MRARDDLMEEHRLILSVLAGVEQRLDAARQAGTLPAPALRNLRDLIRFSREFVDRCHHAKEERCLFPCLEQRGVPREGGLIGVILEEHEAGRALATRIEQALDRYERGEVPAAAVLDPCRAYIDLLRAHIVKEDDVLFPMGDGVMSPDDQAAAVDCFAQRKRDLGAGAHARLEQLAAALARPDGGGGRP